MVRYDKKSADAGRKYIQDRRGRRTGAKAAGGVGGIGAILVILFQLFVGGGDPSAINFDQGAFGGQSAAVDQGAGQAIDPASDPEADTVEYMGFLMGDIQQTWQQIFDDAGLDYQETSLVIFTDNVSTNGCGSASSAVGPFYCPAPADRTVYIDLAFFNELSTRFGAPGDFAQAYVVAHEIGHHIQSVTNVSDQVRQAKEQDPANKNSYAILQELQADCYAGIWASSASARTTISGDPIIEVGDIQEGLRAAQAVGDDSIQGQSGMGINPETWTHGSADQRQKWFTVGLESGNPGDCDLAEISRQES